MVGPRMAAPLRNVAACLVAWLALGPSAASADAEALPAATPRATISLARALELAEANHPNIWAARERLRNMRAQLDEARWAPFSQFTASGGAGPAPTVRGNDLFSPNTDKSLTSNMGLAWRVGVEGVVPLWTFGKITNLWNAAEAQVDVGEADVAKQRNQVRMDVRKAYYGLALARDAESLLDEAAGKLDSAIAKLQKTLDAGDGDEIDMLKLKTFRFELTGRRAEAHKYESIALAALGFLTGSSGAVDIPDAPLKLFERPMGPVTRYLEAARLNRPEVNMVRAGERARAAQVELARARYFPDIGVGLSAVWARAPEVSDQLNPFVRDDANYLRYGAALVFRWQLDMLPNHARVQQAEAQLDELRQTERFALGGIGVEVETAYAQLEDALAREQAYGQAAKVAKRWMIGIQTGIDVGTREETEMIDAARQYALQRYNHLNATMDVNVAWANLSLATGWEDIAPR